jgi:hypothetical protein
MLFASVAAMLLFAMPAVAQESESGKLLLRDGTTVKGQIELSTEGAKVKTPDGNLFYYTYREIKFVSAGECRRGFQMGFDLGFWGFDGSIGGDVVAGWRMNHRLFLGMGVGGYVSTGDGEHTCVPFFVRAQLYSGDKTRRSRFFVGVDLGGGYLQLSNRFSYNRFYDGYPLSDCYASEKSSVGALVQGFVGYEVRVASRSYLSFSVGYGALTGDATYTFPAFRVGYTFRK